MKKCPFCAEEIQLEAIKCKHCGEFLDGRGKAKKEERPWFFRDSVVIGSILMVTVLALPLVWWNRYYSLKNKIIITVVVGVATYFIALALAHATQQISEYYKVLM